MKMLTQAYVAASLRGAGAILFFQMNTADKLEIELLSQAPRDRARLILAAWESLEAASAWLSDPATDPGGIALVRQRDAEIESGEAAVLSQDEFRSRTGGARD